MTRDTDPTNLSGSYALNALDADEVAAFEAHIAASDAARDEVTELSDTAVLLGLAVDPVDPPAGLKASIMSQLDATPQLAPANDAAPGRAERRARAGWMSRPVTALAAAAAVIGLLAGAGVVSTTIRQGVEQQAQVDRLAAITGADDVQRASVGLEPGGSAVLLWSSSLASAALAVEGLEPLPRDRVYQLWFITEAGARSAGTFTTDGSATWRVLDGAIRPGDVVGVTVEPVGGSAAPTTDPVVLIESA